MNYKLTRSNRKTMAIIIRDGQVLVKAPQYVAQSQIDSFVLSKRKWIEGKLDMYESPGFNETLTGSVRIFGQLLKIEVIEGKHFDYEIHSSTLFIYKPIKMSLELCSKKMEEVFKLQLIEILEASVPYYAGLLQLKTPPFKVRRYKRLHGRCSRAGELAFNTYLFHESIEFIHYVVLHECAHLIEFNHSKNFYAIIEKHMPDYKAIIDSSKLKDNLHPDQ